MLDSATAAGAVATEVWGVALTESLVVGSGLPNWLSLHVAVAPPGWAELVLQTPVVCRAAAAASVAAATVPGVRWPDSCGHVPRKVVTMKVTLHDRMS